MATERPEDRGLALGAWGAAQATAAGLAIAFSGLANDLVASLAVQGTFGEVVADPVTGYAFVYTTEIVLLFATLVALGPLVRPSRQVVATSSRGFELSSPSVQISGVL
jgi:BCD family chlorophyll transporter-like MFS transporter